MRVSPILLARGGLRILQGSTVSDVRAMTQYNDKQWKTFKLVTARVAHTSFGEQALAHLPTRWEQVDGSQRDSIEESLGSLFQSKGLGDEVDQDVIRWRMNRVLKNMIRVRKAQEARDAYIEKHVTESDTSEVSSHIARFLTLIRTQIHDYAAENPELTWTEIPFRDKGRIKSAVNAQLEDEGIIAVDDDFMEYQMEMQLMNWKIRTNREREMKEAKDELAKGGRGGKQEGWIDGEA